MVTLKDLNNIDIKDLQNIDWSQLKDRLQSQPGLFIHFLLIIVTLAVLFSSFNTYTQANKQSKIETAELNKRLAALDKFEIAKTQHGDFFKEAPKAIAGDQLTQTLSEFAIKRDVQILSFSPAQNKSNNLISLTSVEVNIASESYANIILFVHDIEESSYPIRIKSWSGTSIASREILTQSSPRQRRFFQRPSPEDEKKNYIRAIITIESVELKNE